MDQALAVGRRHLPLIAAAVLGLLAVLEALWRAAEPVSVSLTLALAATVPLALVRTHLPVVVTITSAATVTALFSVGRPTDAALAANAAIAAALAWRLIVHMRASSRRRAEAQKAAVRTLTEFAALGERARIARELHDVVAHHLSMISLQAEAARVSTSDPEGAKRLAAIAGTARSALTEMRRLLGVLREDAETPPPQRSPQPGLDQLNELIDTAREQSGASTRLIVRGPVAPLDPGLELTAYRIVQEALTNARRHAPGSAVDVELTHGPRELRIRVRDNGPGPRWPPRGGHGLMGMGERAATLGGSVFAGPAPGCGFLVEAWLPVPGGGGS